MFSTTPHRYSFVCVAALAPRGSRRSGRSSSGGSISGSCDGVTPSACPLVNHWSHTPTSPTTYVPGFPASSPSLSPFTKPRAPDVRQLRFGMSRVYWSRELTDFFITALVDECRAGNRPHKTLNRIGKDNVVQRMRDRTGSDWTWETCKHKWDELKKKWSCWKRLNQFSGLGFHPHTGVIQMPEQWWDARIRENPVAKVFRRTVLEREEDLDYIFQNMEGFRNVYKEISSSKKQNHTCSASKKAEDDAEYEAFMRELLDAGVNPVSQEYIMATEVLVDVTRRGAYRPLPSIDAKLAWIKSIYLITKGQPPSV